MSDSQQGSISITCNHCGHAFDVAPKAGQLKNLEVTCPKCWNFVDVATALGVPTRGGEKPRTQTLRRPTGQDFEALAQATPKRKLPATPAGAPPKRKALGDADTTAEVSVSTIPDGFFDDDFEVTVNVPEAPEPNEDEPEELSGPPRMPYLRHTVDVGRPNIRQTEEQQPAKRPAGVLRRPDGKKSEGPQKKISQPPLQHPKKSESRTRLRAMLRKVKDRAEARKDLESNTNTDGTAPLSKPAPQELARSKGRFSDPAPLSSPAEKTRKPLGTPPKRAGRFDEPEPLSTPSMRATQAGAPARNPGKVQTGPLLLDEPEVLAEPLVRTTKGTMRPVATAADSGSVQVVSQAKVQAQRQAQKASDSGSRLQIRGTQMGLPAMRRPGAPSQSRPVLHTGNSETSSSEQPTKKPTLHRTGTFQAIRPASSPSTPAAAPRAAAAAPSAPEKPKEERQSPGRGAPPRREGPLSWTDMHKAIAAEHKDAPETSAETTPRPVAALEPGLARASHTLSRPATPVVPAPKPSRGGLASLRAKLANVKSKSKAQSSPALKARSEPSSPAKPGGHKSTQLFQRPAASAGVGTPPPQPKVPRKSTQVMDRPAAFKSGGPASDSLVAAKKEGGKKTTQKFQRPGGTNQAEPAQPAAAKGKDISNLRSRLKDLKRKTRANRVDAASIIAESQGAKKGGTQVLTALTREQVAEETPEAPAPKVAGTQMLTALTRVDIEEELGAKPAQQADANKGSTEALTKQPEFDDLFQQLVDGDVPATSSEPSAPPLQPERPTEAPAPAAEASASAESSPDPVSPDPKPPTSPEPNGENPQWNEVSVHNALDFDAPDAVPAEYSGISSVAEMNEPIQDAPGVGPEESLPEPTSGGTRLLWGLAIVAMLALFGSLGHFTPYGAFGFQAWKHHVVQGKLGLVGQQTATRVREELPKTAVIQARATAAASIANALAGDAPAHYIKFANAYTASGKEEDAIELLNLALRKKDISDESAALHVTLLADQGKLLKARWAGWRALTLLDKTPKVQSALWGTFERDPALSEGPLKLTPGQDLTRFKIDRKATGLTLLAQIKADTVAFFMPQNEEYPGNHMNELAARRLCALIGCRVRIPDARVAFLQQEALFTVAKRSPQSRTWMKTSVMTGRGPEAKLYGVWAQLPAESAPFAIEHTALWSEWLKASGGKDDNKSAAESLSALTDARVRRKEIKELRLLVGERTVKWLAQQVSETIVLHYLTNSWHHFAADQKNFGRFVTLTESGFQLSDFGESFSEGQDEVMLKRLQEVERFRPELIATLRHMDLEKTRTFMFSQFEDSPEAKIRWTRFTERRRALLQHVDTLVAKHGADKVLSL